MPVELSDNASLILAAVAVYRDACDQVQPAWEKMLQSPVDSAERSVRRSLLTAVRSEVAAARKRLIELALDGRLEVPR